MAKPLMIAAGFVVFCIVCIVALPARRYYNSLHPVIGVPSSETILLSAVLPATMPEGKTYDLFYVKQGKPVVITITHPASNTEQVIKLSPADGDIDKMLTFGTTSMGSSFGTSPAQKVVVHLKVIW